MNNIFKVIILCAFIYIISGCSDQVSIIHVSGQANNDIYAILISQQNTIVKRYDSPMTAATEANIGEAVMVLAESYPKERTKLSREFFNQVRQKKLRVYLEYPSWLPGVEIGARVQTSLERAVVSSGFFNGSPDSLDILVINGLNYCPVDVQKSHIVAARIAGFDKAVYGLPEKTYPLLFEMPDDSIIVSTTCFSRLIRGRYAPQQEWANVWQTIMAYLLPEAEAISLNWKSPVRPFYGKEEKLPADYQKQSVKHGAEWYINARMLVHESYIDTVIGPNQVGLLKWDEALPIGDGTHGAMEAIMSVIDEDGGQPIGTSQRGDCISETAMTFALAGNLFKNDVWRNTSRNLLDYYFYNSPAGQNEWVDPNHGAYGLTPWGISNYAWYKANYGDDNARVLLSTMVAAAVNKTRQWDETMMKILLAQLRTTGINGFRGNRIDLPDFTKNGWEYYSQRDIINIAPHYEAYLWACYLWAYDKTGYKPFLQKAERAIRITMENYPDGWKWTNGLAQEKARMILPLSWLLRVHNTPENKEKLFMVVNDLLKLQDSCGAIREELGDLKMGRYPPPQSNEDYGTNEASLIGKNGDRISDLLYTTNFAFLGLHEAAFATGDPRIEAAADKLAEFLCRIQIYSEDHKQLHGGWFRAFDFGRYEHWGCNADHGWGAWCIESGWTQGWITSILALREMDLSIWDLTKDATVNSNFESLKKQMLPE